jgi:hypothetical protein
MTALRNQNKRMVAKQVVNEETLSSDSSETQRKLKKPSTNSRKRGTEPTRRDATIEQQTTIIKHIKKQNKFRLGSKKNLD